MIDSFEQYYDPNVSIEEVNKNREETFDPINEKLKELAEERVQQFKDMLEDPQRRNKLLYFVPGLNIAKLSAEAAKGETTFGEELDTSERIVYLLEAVALSYAIAVLGKEITGTATHDMLLAATAGKVSTFVGHQIMMNKDTVIGAIQNITQGVADSAFAQALIKAVSTIPENMFSNKIVNPEDFNA